MNHQLAQLKLPGGGTLSNPQGFIYNGNAGIGDIITKAIPFIIGIAGLGLLLMLISAGYTFMTSAGDAKKMEAGKQQLTNAIIGFFIIFGAYWVVQILGIMFGSGITPGFK